MEHKPKEFCINNVPEVNNEPEDHNAYMAWEVTNPDYNCPQGWRHVIEYSAYEKVIKDRNEMLEVLAKHGDLLCKQRDELETLCKDYITKITKLTEALEFYADEDNHGVGDWIWAQSKVDRDMGRTARRVLDYD